MDIVDVSTASIAFSSRIMTWFIQVRNDIAKTFVIKNVRNLCRQVGNGEFMSYSSPKLKSGSGGFMAQEVGVMPVSS